MIKSYNIDDRLETLKGFGLSIQPTKETNLNKRVEKDKNFLDALEKYLVSKEAKSCLNFDQMRIQKRKRDTFEEPDGAKILNDDGRLEILEDYINEKNEKEK